ncbi:MAG TPA: type II secretion system protein GspK [Xanthobacteraceae bacterium]|jgi:general secretion pathway protein K|nr:type II secretion system protein GspK [Xanthobacteraceae bacterium]
MNDGGCRRRAHDRGFIIVAVLWIVLALATFASIYAAYVVRTADAVGSSDRRIRAQALFTSALELTAYRMTAIEKDKRPPAGQFDFRLGRATVLVGFSSEAGRIDLNAAPKPLLASLFVTLGARPQDAEGYADRVLAWRGTAAGNASQDTEADAYRSAGLNYAPRHAPFQDVGELWLVLGLPPALVERALPYVTVFSGIPQVNVLAAPPLVLAALPGITPEQVNALLEARRSVPDPKAVLASLEGVRANATVEVGRSMRVSVVVRFDDGSRSGADIVMLLTDDDQEPYRILSWRDDFDQIASAGG